MIIKAAKIVLEANPNQCNVQQVANGRHSCCHSWSVRPTLSSEVDLHNVLINTEKTFIHIHTDAFQG